MKDESPGSSSQDEQPTQKPAKAEHIALAVIIVLGLLLTFVQAYNFDLNSDQSQSALIYYDLLEERPHPLAGWYLPTNNYLFTDSLFYVITGGLFGMGPTTVRLTSWVIFLMGIAVAAAIVARAFSKRAALYMAAVLMFMPAIATHELLAPQNHNGNILFTLIAYLLALLLLNSRDTGRKDAIVLLPLLALVITTGVFSDPTMLFTFSLPFALTLVVVSALRRELPASGAKTLSLIMIVMLASGGAILLQYAVSMNTGLQLSKFLMQTNSIAIDKLPEHLGFTLKMLAMLLGLMESDGGFSIINIARALLLLAALASALWALKHEGDLQRQYFLIFLLVMGSLIVASFVFRAKPFALSTARYLIPVLYSQAVFIGIALSGYYKPVPGSLQRYRYVVLSAFLVCIMLASAGVATTQANSQRHQGLSEYLKGNGLEYGYSQYWSANIITLLTENHVKVRPIEFTIQGLSPFFWSTNEFWYNRSASTQPSFILVPAGEQSDGFSVASAGMLAAMFGETSMTMEYEGAKIYVWDRNILSPVK